MYYITRILYSVVSIDFFGCCCCFYSIWTMTISRSSVFSISFWSLLIVFFFFGNEYRHNMVDFPFHYAIWKWKRFYWIPRFSRFTLIRKLKNFHYGIRSRSSILYLFLAFWNLSLSWYEISSANTIMFKIKSMKFPNISKNWWRHKAFLLFIQFYFR